MAKEPNGPPHLHLALTERLQSSDKAAAIELYYELLSAGHSVGDILAVVGPVRGKVEPVDTGSFEQQQSEIDGTASNFASCHAVSDAAQANERCASAPNAVLENRCGTDKPATTESPSLDELGAEGRNQIPRPSLPRSEAAPEHAHGATGAEAPLHFVDQEPRPGGLFPRIAKRVAVGALYAATVAAVAIVGFSSVQGHRDAEPAVVRLQPHNTGGGDVVEPSRPAGPATAIPDPPQTVAAEVPREIFNARLTAVASPNSVSQPNAIAAMAVEDGAASSRINQAAPVEPVAPAASAGDAVDPDRRNPDFTALVGDETEGRPEEPGGSLARAATLREANRAAAPAVVALPAAQPVAAVPGPRVMADGPEDQRFQSAAADAMLARGDEFFATGDLASARLFYERAASAGSGAAALRLGGTFDPAFLARVRIGRVQGDMPSALYWYRRARDLGNGDAAILLTKMENTAR